MMRALLLVASLSTALSASCDVFAFGAVGDGLADDTAAIRAALAACAAPNSTVHLPATRAGGAPAVFLSAPLNLTAANLTFLLAGTLLATCEERPWHDARGLVPTKLGRRHPLWQWHPLRTDSRARATLPATAARVAARAVARALRRARVCAAPQRGLCADIRTWLSLTVRVGPCVRVCCAVCACTGGCRPRWRAAGCL